MPCSSLTFEEPFAVFVSVCRLVAKLTALASSLSSLMLTKSLLSVFCES